MAAAKEGNITLPNWTATPSFASPLPKSNDVSKIPPNTRVESFAGLPASTGPKPMKIEGH